MTPSEIPAGAVLQRLDAAIDAVHRAERRDLRTRTGAPATDELAALRSALVAERDQVRDGRGVDVGRLGALVREVAAWTPDSELKLLAALGAVVQAARAAAPNSATGSS